MPNSIKVAHIVSQINGGAGIAAYRLHNKMQRISGIESVLIQKNSVSSDSKNVFRSTQYHSIYYRIINKLGLKGRFFKEDKYRKWITEHPAYYEYISLPYSTYPIEQHPEIQDADIIHLHWVANFLNYPSFFKQLNKPIVWTLHDMNPFLGVFHYENDVARNLATYGGIENQVKKDKRRYIQQNKNINVVCLNEWMKQKSENSLALSDYTHTIIPNGINLNIEYITKEKNNLKKEIGISNENTTLFVTAQDLAIARKGVDILIDALKLLEKYDYNIITLGGTKPQFCCPNHIHIEYTSDLKLINSLYYISDATIIPSREDNLPNVMLESFANGTPVISFANGGMAEHIVTGENGILLKDIDAQSLAQGITDLIEGKYKFDRDKINGCAREKFSDVIQAEKYLQLYQKILNK